MPHTIPRAYTTISTAIPNTNMADAHVIHVKPAGSASAFAAEQEEQLVAMLRSTASELLAVWAQEGLPPAEQAAQLQGLRSQLLELLTAKVKDEKDMFNKYVEDVDRLRGEIERMANSIGASVDWVRRDAGIAARVVHD